MFLPITREEICRNCDRSPDRPRVHGVGGVRPGFRPLRGGNSECGDWGRGGRRGWGYGDGLLLRNRQHDLQQKSSAVRTADALAVIFFRCGADIGNTETVEEAVFFWRLFPAGRFAGGIGVIFGVVFHGNEEHVPQAVRFDSDEALFLRELFTGLDGIVQRVSEDRADVQRIEKISRAEVDRGGKLDTARPRSRCV